MGEPESVFIYVWCNMEDGLVCCYDTLEAMGHEFDGIELEMLMKGESLWINDETVVVARCKLNS